MKRFKAAVQKRIGGETATTYIDAANTQDALALFDTQGFEVLNIAEQRSTTDPLSDAVLPYASGRVTGRYDALIKLGFLWRALRIICWLMAAGSFLAGIHNAIQMVAIASQSSPGYTFYTPYSAGGSIARPAPAAVGTDICITLALAVFQTPPLLTVLGLACHLAPDYLRARRDQAINFGPGH